MANFLKHTNCSSCGSSDAKAVYSDGGWFCFSCRASGQGSVLSKLKPVILDKEKHTLPEDLTNHFPLKYIEWFNKYEITIYDLIKYKVFYSPSWDRIYYTWDNTDVWQARQIDPKKLFTSGNHENVLLLYYCGTATERVVLTEDPVSAFKIASLSSLKGPSCDTMPLLGAHLPSMKLVGLKRLYSRVDVFLDHDKGKAAMNMSRRLRLLGLSSSVFIHQLDPKEITYSQLAKILK